MAAVFESISSGKQNAGVGMSFTLVAAPPGLQVGDLLVTIWGASVTTAGATIFEPPGFTKITQDNPTTINFPKGAMAFKVADAGDLTGNYLYTQSTGFSPSWSVGMYRISNALGIDGFAVAFVENIVQSTLPTPSLVTTADNVLILRAPIILQAGSPPTNIIPPAGITERAEEITAVGGISISFATQDALVTPPGPSGVETFTHDGTSNCRGVLYTLGIAGVPAAAGMNVLINRRRRRT